MRRVSKQDSPTVRLLVGIAKAAMILTLVAATGLSVSGQDQREWRDYAGGPDSSRFVAAKQITKSNVNLLQVAWSYPSGQTDFNPLVVRGVVYGRGANDSFVALDAATGKQLWIHEGVQGFNSRGVNYWESKDGKDRRLIFSVNNILQEIDAQTGRTIPSFGVDGRVDLRVGLDRDPSTVNQQSRLPGRVFENLIVLGSATNQEYASAPGDIRAFDVRTGAKVWTFHTVPRPGEFGYDTWPADAWKTVGGANNWAEQSIDEKRGIIYIPTGSPKYNFYGGNRKGANLFGDCILALDVRTGARVRVGPSCAASCRGSWRGAGRARRCGERDRRAGHGACHHRTGASRRAGAEPRRGRHAGSRDLRRNRLSRGRGLDAASGADSEPLEARHGRSSRALRYLGRPRRTGGCLGRASHDCPLHVGAT